MLEERRLGWRIGERRAEEACAERPAGDGWIKGDELIAMRGEHQRNVLCSLRGIPRRLLLRRGRDNDRAMLRTWRVAEGAGWVILLNVGKVSFWETTLCLCEQDYIMSAYSGIKLVSFNCYFSNPLFIQLAADGNYSGAQKDCNSVSTSTQILWQIYV